MRYYAPKGRSAIAIMMLVMCINNHVYSGGDWHDKATSAIFYMAVCLGTYTVFNIINSAARQPSAAELQLAKYKATTIEATAAVEIENLKITNLEKQKTLVEARTQGRVIMFRLPQEQLAAYYQHIETAQTLLYDCQNKYPQQPEQCSYQKMLFDESLKLAAAASHTVANEHKTI